MSHMKELAVEQLNLLRDLKEVLIETLHDCTDHFIRKRIEESIDAVNELLN